jgi:hypothetical protein
VLKQADKPSYLGGGDVRIKLGKTDLTAPWRFEAFLYSNPDSDRAVL